MLTAGFFTFDKFIIELHVLRGSNKKQRSGRIISNFIFYLYQPSDVLQCGPLLAPFQKRSIFPLQFGQEENISGNSIERRVIYLFILKTDRVLRVPAGRVGTGR